MASMEDDDDFELPKQKSEGTEAKEEKLSYRDEWILSHNDDIPPWKTDFGKMVVIGYNRLHNWFQNGDHVNRGVTAAPGVQQNPSNRMHAGDFEKLLAGKVPRSDDTSQQCNFATTGARKEDGRRDLHFNQQIPLSEFGQAARKHIRKMAKKSAKWKAYKTSADAISDKGGWQLRLPTVVFGLGWAAEHDNRLPRPVDLGIDDEFRVDISHDCANGHLGCIQYRHLHGEPKPINLARKDCNRVIRCLDCNGYLIGNPCPGHGDWGKCRPMVPVTPCNCDQPSQRR